MAVFGLLDPSAAFFFCTANEDVWQCSRAAWHSPLQLHGSRTQYVVPGSQGGFHERHSNLAPGFVAGTSIGRMAGYLCNAAHVDADCGEGSVSAESANESLVGGAALCERERAHDFAHTMRAVHVRNPVRFHRAQ